MVRVKLETNIAAKIAIEIPTETAMQIGTKVATQIATKIATQIATEVTSVILVGAKTTNEIEQLSDHANMNAGKKASEAATE